MVDSDSSLSSAPPSDDEMPVDMEPATLSKGTPQKKKKQQGNILSFFKQKERSPTPPPRKKREPSPEHVYGPQDNPNIAFIVMFRSRFNDAFPRGAPHVGPQDIEQGVVGETPSSDVEGLLCALLGLVLNRKKPVEKGHYGRALEESIQTQKSQWPPAWKGVNPLSGGRNFLSMNEEERITLLHTLCMWSLNQNEQVKLMITNAYKARTTKDKLDTNIPLSVQPWGVDGEKRRYWLVEGQSDTHFRVYRETDPHKTKKVKWFSVAGDIDELRSVATKLLEEDGRSQAKTLSERMINAIPRFEVSEQKRQRREYRQQRKAVFTRPDPGFSLYEGRTRGKRLRYTYSDGEEDVDSDNLGARRSTRTSGRETPAVPSGPTVTASGRHVRSRATGLYGETLHSGQVSDRASPATGDYVRSDMSEEPQQPHAHGRSTRAAANRGTSNGRPSRTIASDDEEDATSWDGGDEDEDEPEQMDLDDDDEEDQVDDSSEDEEEPQSLLVTLRYGKNSKNVSNGHTTNIGAAEETNGIEHDPEQLATAPLAGYGAPRQPELHAPPPIEPPVQTAPSAQPIMAQQPQAPMIHNGVAMLPELPQQPPVVSVAQPSMPDPNVLPKLDGMFDAPEQNGVPPQPQQPPVLPPPTPASNWQ